MVFSSSIFLFVFLPLLFLIYFVVAEQFKNIVLLLGSLLFYAWGEPRNIAIMLLSIIVNYVLGYAVEKEWGYKKLFLVVAIIYNLGVLYVFKYLNFTVETINIFTGNNIKIERIVLPIGISFYTFQIMSYVIDVYKGKVKAQRNILDLALYISLFPQLIAGPIVRYVDIESMIKCRATSWDKVKDGIIRFTIGFSKKVLIADQLSPLVEVVFKGVYPSIVASWIGIVAYTLQIFFDFSGYSDMAIGLGKIFGFEFTDNFNYPYISQSIQEFWRRWHISLSEWFRDYLYIPLGGNRKGNLRTYINLIVVFFLTGLWHGSSFNFIVWGLYYGIFLIIERLGFKSILIKMPKVVRHMYSLLVIAFGWVLFRADNLRMALNYIKGMFFASGRDIAHFNFIMNRQYWFFLLAGIFFSRPHPKIKALVYKNHLMESAFELSILIVFIVAVCYMVGSGYSPFLYFRF